MMNAMKRVSLIALLVTVAGGSLVQQAQADTWRPTYDTYQTNRRNEYKDLLNDIKNESDRFADHLDRALNRSRLNNSNREDRLNDIAKDLKNQARRVRDRFNNRNLQRSDIQQLLAIANRMDVALRSTRQNLGGDVRSDWARLRSDLNRLDRYGYNNNRY